MHFSGMNMVFDYFSNINLSYQCLSVASEKINSRFQCSIICNICNFFFKRKDAMNKDKQNTE